MCICVGFNSITPFIISQNGEKLTQNRGNQKHNNSGNYSQDIVMESQQEALLNRNFLARLKSIQLELNDNGTVKVMILKAKVLFSFLV